VSVALMLMLYVPAGVPAIPPPQAAQARTSKSASAKDVAQSFEVQKLCGFSAIAKTSAAELEERKRCATRVLPRTNGFLAPFPALDCYRTRRVDHGKWNAKWMMR